MRRTLLLLSCLALLSLGFAPFGDGEPEQLRSRRKVSWDHFGSLSTIVAYDDFESREAAAHFEATWRMVYDMLTEIEETLSVAVEGSDIHRFNAAAPGELVSVQPLTAKMVAMAQEMHAFTNGTYNPAVMHLVDLWGFSPRFGSREYDAEPKPYDRPRNPNRSFDLPDEEYVAAFRQLADFSAVELIEGDENGHYLVKHLEDVEVRGEVYSLGIDLGGLAKGYAAERAAEILHQSGYEFGMSDVGASSLQLLKRPVATDGAPDMYQWGVHVGDPDEPARRYLTIYDQNTGVSTSGTYLERYFLDGKEYSHIIDPATGRPTTSQVISATIVGGRASYIDAITTGLVVMPLEEAIAFMDTHLTEYRVVLLYRCENDSEQVCMASNVADGFLRVHKY